MNYQEFTKGKLTSGIAIDATYLSITKDDTSVDFPISGKFRVVVWDATKSRPFLDSARERMTLEWNVGESRFDIVSRGDGETSAKAWDADSNVALILAPEDLDGFENSANKETSALDTSTDKYPCNNVVKTAVDAKVAKPVSATDGNIATFDTNQNAIQDSGHNKSILDALNTPLSDEGLVLYLPFDENTGTTAYDKSHNGYNGTFKGAGEPAWAEGHKNSCVDGDGIDDQVIVQPVYNNATEITVMCWARKEGYNQYQQLYSDYSGGNANLMCGYESSENQIRFYCGSGASVVSLTVSNVWLANEWFHWAFVYKGGEYMRIYRNGVMVGEKTDSIPATIAATHNDRYIFGYDVFNGKIDEFRMYSRALSANEVMARYLKG